MRWTRELGMDVCFLEAKISDRTGPGIQGAMSAVARPKGV
jgi:hypothetical protein